MSSRITTENVSIEDNGDVVTIKVHGITFIVEKGGNVTLKSKEQVSIKGNVVLDKPVNIDSIPVQTGLPQLARKIFKL